VSGHDFSRADRGRKIAGFSPCGIFDSCPPLSFEARSGSAATIPPDARRRIGVGGSRGLQPSGEAENRWAFTPRRERRSGLQESLNALSHLLMREEFSALQSFFASGHCVSEADAVRTLCGESQHGLSLLARHAELFHQLVNAYVLEILEDCRNRRPSTSKYPSAAALAGNALHGGALRPVKRCCRHFPNLDSIVDSSVQIGKRLASVPIDRELLAQDVTFKEHRAAEKENAHNHPNRKDGECIHHCTSHSPHARPFL
jgi:hypothetical protein